MVIQLFFYIYILLHLYTAVESHISNKRHMYTHVETNTAHSVSSFLPKAVLPYLLLI